jgi:alkanesulfonate monooxygenase
VIGTTGHCGWQRPRASGAQGNSTALVGSPQTVAQALLDYVDLGVTTILIRGYDPVDDAVDYGRHLIPLVKQELAHRSLVSA